MLRTFGSCARALALACGVMMLGSCATYSDRTQEARTAVAVGDYEGGARYINKFLKVRKNEDLPNKYKKDTALAVLERATILHALGLYELSARDFQEAERELEFLDLAKDGVGKIGKYMFSDSAAKYKTPPSERLTLNAMNMINYLARGDLQGASVEARRFTVMRQYLRDHDPEHAHGAFGSYLAGFTFERLGESDRAIRYYAEAQQAGPIPGLQEPVGRLKGGSRTGPASPASPEPGPASPESEAGPAPQSPAAERPEGASQPPSGQLGFVPQSRKGLAAALPAASADEAELLVIVKIGRVPYKVPRRIPIGAAVGIAHAYITGDPRVLERSAFKVVTFPDLEPAGNVFKGAAVRVDGQQVALDFVTDLGAEVEREYDELKPKIIASAITRMITRAAAAEGARAAGNQAEGDAGAIVGLLAAFAVEGSMVALDKPDTRSWTLMPDHVYIARIRVAPGKHTVVAQADAGSKGGDKRVFEVEVEPGGFAVLDFTTLR